MFQQTSLTLIKLFFGGSVIEKIICARFTEHNETNKNAEDVLMLSGPVCRGGSKN